MSKTQDPDADDDDLDYIGKTDVGDDQPSANDVTKLGGDQMQQVHRPSRPRRVRDTRYDQNTKLSMPTRKSVSMRRDKSSDNDRRSRKKSETPKASVNSSAKSNKKAKDQQRKERNKTLTQMDFVQRWVKLESDDDSALDYMYYTPKENHRKSHGYDDKGDVCNARDSSGSKRRKLEDPESKDTNILEKVPLEQKPSQDPVTPQKQRKLEIPSSQSPASPGLAIISSSQFRSATRSPLKRMSANVSVWERESPASQRKKSSQGSPASQAGSTMSPTTGSSMIPSSQVVPQPAVAESPAPNDGSTRTPQMGLSTPKSENGMNGNLQTNSPRRERTVVYETDAETESGDVQDDDLPSGPPSPTKQVVDELDQAVEGNQSSQNIDDSLDLPPPPDPATESCAPYSQPPMSSNASVCYRRIDRPTQYPLEPIPTLNTQKMAELFPQGNTQLEGTALASETQSYPSTTSHSVHGHREHTPTHDLDNMSTQIVPESSPVTRQDDEPALNNSIADQSRLKSVIQVESSQPADRFNKRQSVEESYPQAILSRSDLLSSSVMESVPMPQFLSGTQSSVGEPYSVPDDKDG